MRPPEQVQVGYWFGVGTAVGAIDTSPLEKSNERQVFRHNVEAGVFKSFEIRAHEIENESVIHEEVAHC